MHRNIVFLLLVLISCCLSASAQSSATLNLNEASTILRGRSFAELKKNFDRYRTPVYDQSFRSLIIAANIKQGELRVQTDKNALERLRWRLLPVLQLYGRESIDLVIFQAPAPNAICIGGTALFFSTGLFEVIDRDEELQAIAAHELAHEYLNTLALAARDRKDYQTLRSVERICDVFAVAALRELKINASFFKSGLEKLTSSSYASPWKGDGTDTHPPLRERLASISSLDAAFSGK